ncbi:MAG TPA: EAL domain-containing protein [Microthrixaceae bacterium]|nr:EAL domain-containing protein [Microthrixaceae bacterium]
MATLSDIVAVEAEFTALLNNPRRSLSRFAEVSLDFGQMLAEPDPHRALEALSLAIETLRNPPAEPEIPVALGLLRTMRSVAARLGEADHELDAIGREGRILDGGLVEIAPGEREALWQRAAAVRFGEGDVAAGFGELMEGLRWSGPVGIEPLTTDLLIAVRRTQLPAELLNDLIELWFEIRRERAGDAYGPWCLVALGALQLTAGDTITAQMYMRQADKMFGNEQRPALAALVGGWVALSADDAPTALNRFVSASQAPGGDARIRLLAAAGLGEALVALGRVDEARKPLNEAIAYDVGDPNTVARSHELLSEIAAGEGRYEDAYQHLTVARRLEQPMVVHSTPQRVHGVPTELDLRDRSEPIVLPSSPLRTASEEIAAHARSVERAAREASAAAGLDATLEMHLSPILENASGDVRAALAVMWLVHPDGAAIPAATLSEREELRRQLALHTLRRGCRSLATWASDLMMVIDLSEISVTSELVEAVETQLRESGADASRLVVLLSGLRLLRSSERSAVVDGLRDLGVRLGITGLGSSFDSTEELLSWGVDLVVIDDEVLSLADRGRAQRVVATVSALANGFGFDLLATGVGNEESFARQVSAGCHAAVGPHVGPALSEAAFRHQHLIDTAIDSAIGSVAGAVAGSALT